jgi:carbon starvation protein
VTVWLWRTRRAWWVWVVTGIPTVFMYIMSTWALLTMTLPKFTSEGKFTIPSDPVPWIGLVLMSLAAVMLVEAIRILLGTGTARPNQPAPVIAATPAAGG